MYKLILVDDEEDVREGVTQEIEWEKYGFQAVEKAQNGREAMELIDLHAPDVVITDISMPFMDGLQLSEWIREKYPTIKIIILSGYDEFEYAQKAVKLKIYEYVLKPFSSQELIDVLLKVKSQIDTEMAQRENLQTLKDHYIKSLPVLREVFLASLVTGKLSQEEIQEKAANYRVDLLGSAFSVAVLRMDNLAKDETAGNRPEETTAHTGSLQKSDDRELKLFAALNIAEEIVRKHEAGIVFMLNDRVVLLHVSDQSNRGRMMDKTLAILEEVRQSIGKYLKFSVTIGMGSVSGSIAGISYSYDGAVLALDYGPILGNDRVICIDDVETRFVEKVRFDELKEHALTRCIKVGTVSELQDIVNELFDGIMDANVSIKDYQIYLLEIFTTILRAAKDASIDLDGVFGPSSTLFAEFDRFTTLQEAKSWMIGLCVRIMNSIADDRQYTYKHLVDQAIAYTKQHYHESDISINKLCGHLHISAGYFSGIFKKEVKTTFVSYLLQMRMEAAKEMLRSTDLRAFEIAEKVGFSDPNYFSFCFKKNIGISPKEYRNSSRGV